MANQTSDQGPNRFSKQSPNGGGAAGAALARGRIHIGISGWRYPPWRGVFYPPRLPQRRELEFASRQFGTVEINGTFYSLQRPASFQKWAAETPEDFLFAVKGSRFITHMKKLRGIDEAFSNLLASGLLALGAKLGPMLWQFPPRQSFEPKRFAEFFRMLPRTTTQAAELAERCSERMLPRSVFSAETHQPLHHAVEIRHESFVTPRFVDLLREHGVGLVVADTVEWPLLLDATSPIVYVRLHGSEALYASRYSDRQLELWAERLLLWAAGETPEHDRAGANPARIAGLETAPVRPRDVFVYFDNDIKVHAPFDAARLQARVDHLLGIAPRQPLVRYGPESEP